jgi:hypothetical protein
MPTLTWNNLGYEPWRTLGGIADITITSGSGYLTQLTIAVDAMIRNDVYFIHNDFVPVHIVDFDFPSKLQVALDRNTNVSVEIKYLEMDLDKKEDHSALNEPVGSYRISGVIHVYEIPVINRYDIQNYVRGIDVAEEIMGRLQRMDLSSFDVRQTYVTSLKNTSVVSPGKDDNHIRYTINYNMIAMVSNVEAVQP